MEEQSNSEFRTAAYSILNQIFQQDVSYRARHTINTLVEQLNISEENAKDLMWEFSSARGVNEFPGNVRNIPVFDPEKKPTDTGSYEDELHKRFSAFALNYIEHVTERDDRGILFHGRTCLGNTDEETTELVEKMQANPIGVVKYIEWGFQKDRTLADTLIEFINRTEEGTLRPPAFE